MPPNPVGCHKMVHATTADTKLVAIYSSGDTKN